MNGLFALECFSKLHSPVSIEPLDVFFLSFLLMLRMVINRVALSLKASAALCIATTQQIPKNNWLFPAFATAIPFWPLGNALTFI